MANGAGRLALIRAGQDAQNDIATFLSQHLTTAMFPLSNLQAHGMDGDHPLSMRFWMRQAAGQITDVLGLTGHGLVFPVCPTAPWVAVRTAMTGQRVSGVLGDATQSRPLLQALGLASVPMNHDTDEVLYDLDLANLRVPAGIGVLVPFAASPRDIIIGMLRDYLVEALNTPADKAMRNAVAQFERFSVTGSHVALMDGDTPLAMAGFNADVGNTVQVGGVFTPHGLRGHGFAARVVGLHLQKARGVGRRRAILFSDNPVAQRVYERLGFDAVGRYTMALLQNEVRIDG